jgi:hypothetical protein
MDAITPQHSMSLTTGFTTWTETISAFQTRFMQAAFAVIAEGHATGSPRYLYRSSPAAGTLIVGNEDPPLENVVYHEVYEVIWLYLEGYRRMDRDLKSVCNLGGVRMD